jgi:transposase-like protein
MNKTDFDFNKALEQLQAGQGLTGKNGVSKKTVKTSVRQFELETPRDREGTFEPQLVKKHQTKLTPEIDQKTLVLYALGTSYRDIRFHI